MSAIGRLLGALNTSTASGGVSISCTVGNAAAAGNTASVAQNVTISCGVGNASASGLTAGVAQVTTISCGIGSASASGLTSGIAQAASIACSVGSASANGLQSSVSQPVSIGCSIGNASANGLTADVQITGGSTNIPCSTGNATASGLTASVSQNTDISCGLGNAVANGSSATILQDQNIACNAAQASAIGLGCTITSGSIPDNRLDQILAILTGRKVYNEATNTWHVYDSDGNELVDTSGILLQGLHGFILRNQIYQEVSEDFFGGGPINWETKRKKKDEEEIAEIIEKEIESIIEEKVKVISRKQNAKPESEDYWSLHLYENLLNQRIAEITTEILLQKIRDNAINALRQKAIEEALFKRQLEIERALFIEYQRMIEEDMIFVFSMLAEM